MSLHVSALSLSQFRNHRRVELALDGRPVALYGPNGAGKTNLIEAVSLLSPGRGLRRATADALARQPGGLGWKIEAAIAGAGLGHEITLSAAPEQARLTRIDGKAAPQTALGRILRVLWLVPSQDRLWIEGAEGRRRFLDRMTLSFEPSHADVTLAYEKAMRERNRLLKEHVTDARWYGALEAQMASAAEAIMRHRRDALARISEAQTAAATAFPSADLTLEAGELGSEAEFAAAFADGRARDLTAGRTLQGPHRADVSAIYREKGMAAKHCSTGEQKALLISLVLANARALKEDTGTPPLLLLDEVAAHLDASRRAALFDEICALEAQAWMTGTGPELFEELGPRAQRFAVQDGEVSPDSVLG